MQVVRAGALAFLALAGVLAATAALAEPRAITSRGELRGIDQDGVAVFRGIPFAAAPVGPLRWRPPEPGPSWDGERDASAFGPRCPQRDRMRRNVDAVLRLQGVGWISRQLVKASMWLQRAVPIDEDCLYLNVQTANLRGDARQPVMVWIHGGGHSNGAGSQRPYESNALVERGVVQVTFNYRLGALGFLAHPALSAESERSVSGNYGTLDQIAALQWVRDEIAAFGGDPANVTIFGESAGGHSVGQLMASPLARGLFQRAIAMSGSGTHQLLHLRAGLPARPSAEALGSQIARKAGVEPGPGAARALRALDVEDVVEMGDDLSLTTSPFHPVVDGWVLPKTPFEVFAAGAQAPVPLMVGTTDDEGSLFVELAGSALPTVVGDDVPLASAEAYRAALERRFGEQAPAIEERYPGVDAASLRRSTGAIFTDAYFGANARYLAAMQQRRGRPAWLYLFTRTPPGVDEPAGAIHGADVPFVFGAPTPIGPRNEWDDSLARAIGDYLVQFARTGDPNQDGRPQWPRYDPDAPAWMELGGRIGSAPVSRADAYDLFDRVQARRAEALRAVRESADGG
jgi:para-nitrobenzyl esterase